MRTAWHRLVSVGGTTVIAAVTAVAIATPATADPSDCSVRRVDSLTGIASCPAGAGTFEFRVTADCVATIGGTSHFYTSFGPWRQPSSTETVSSQTSCFLKGAALSFGIEFR